MTDMKEPEPAWRLPVPTADSATIRISINRQKISILTALNEVLKERRSVEHRRNSLLQTAAVRQHQVQETKNKCEAAWQEKIAAAQALGSKYESQCAALRERRDVMHKQLIAAIEGSSPNKMDQVPSIREKKEHARDKENVLYQKRTANYKMQACQLQRDIAEMKRRVSNAKFRLESETKAAHSLYGVVKQLRSEAGAKKLNSVAIRPQTLALLSHATQCRPTRENFRMSSMKNTATRFSTPIAPLGKAQ